MRARKIVAVIDASSGDGEDPLLCALSMAAPEHGSVIAVVALEGASALAFRQYADAEGISVAESAQVYLAQVDERLGRPDVHLAGLSVASADVVAEAIDLATRNDASLVVLPSTMTVTKPRRRRRRTGTPTDVALLTLPG